MRVLAVSRIDTRKVTTKKMTHMKKKLKGVYNDPGRSYRGEDKVEKNDKI